MANPEGGRSPAADFLAAHRVFSIMEVVIAFIDNLPPLLGGIAASSTWAAARLARSRLTGDQLNSLPRALATLSRAELTLALGGC